MKPDLNVLNSNCLELTISEARHNYIVKKLLYKLFYDNHSNSSPSHIDIRHLMELTVLDISHVIDFHYAWDENIPTRCDQHKYYTVDLRDIFDQSVEFTQYRLLGYPLDEASVSVAAKWYKDHLKELLLTPEEQCADMSDLSKSDDLTRRMLVPLPCVDVAPGHVVIINEDDKPCTKLLAVVVYIDDAGVAWCQYLNQELRKQYRKKEDPGDLRLIPTTTATPLERFGLVPYLDPAALVQESGQAYSVKRVAPSKAQYSDNKPRDWDEVI